MSRHVHLVDTDPALPALLAPALVGRGFYPIPHQQEQAVAAATQPGAWIVRVGDEALSALAVIQAVRQQDPTTPILALISSAHPGVADLSCLWGADVALRLPVVPSAIVGQLEQLRAQGLSDRGGVALRVA